jgi:hypothetical protein
VVRGGDGGDVDDDRIARYANMIPLRQSAHRKPQRDRATVRELALGDQILVPIDIAVGDVALDTRKRCPWRGGVAGRSCARGVDCMGGAYEASLVVSFRVLTLGVFAL